MNPAPAQPQTVPNVHSKLVTTCKCEALRGHVDDTEKAFLFVFWAKYAAFMDCTDQIYHLTYSTDQSRAEDARGHFAGGRQVA